jgi:hypothetical protein
MEAKSEKTISEFIEDIEKLVAKGGVDYIDAILYYCEKENIELEVAAKIIKSNPKIKANLQNSAELLNFLPKRAKLPV